MLNDIKFDLINLLDSEENQKELSKIIEKLSKPIFIQFRYTFYLSIITILFIVLLMIFNLYFVFSCYKQIHFLSYKD